MAGHTLFRAYYMTLAIYALFGILDAFYALSIESMGEMNLFFHILGMVFQAAIFTFSIIALIAFIKRRLSKITWVLPILHICLPLLLCVYTIFWILLMITQGIPFAQSPLPPGSAVFGMIAFLFTLGFAGYLLHRHD